MSEQLPLHAQVRVIHGDVRHLGVITEVNDPDQGDLEYYVTYEDEDGDGSYWPRENLYLLT